MLQRRWDIPLERFYNFDSTRWRLGEEHKRPVCVPERVDNDKVFTAGAPPAGKGITVHAFVNGTGSEQCAVILTPTESEYKDTHSAQDMEPPAALVYAAGNPSESEGIKLLQSKSGVLTQAVFDRVLGFWLNRVCSGEGSENEPARVLILDNCSAHKAAYVQGVCLRYNVHVVFLPPHTTHFLQPLDYCYFNLLKMRMNTVADAVYASFSDRRLTQTAIMQEAFGVAVATSVHKTDMRNVDMSNTFYRCGISCPMDLASNGLARQTLSNFGGGAIQNRPRLTLDEAVSETTMAFTRDFSSDTEPAHNESTPSRSSKRLYLNNATPELRSAAAAATARIEVLRSAVESGAARAVEQNTEVVDPPNEFLQEYEKNLEDAKLSARGTVVTTQRRSRGRPTDAYWTQVRSSISAAHPVSSAQLMP